MKTLKKVLSVALVLAMALSLVTLVGAANVSKYQDFTDADAIVNKEAVDTLVGLRVLDGLEDGSFGPEGYLTRAQAAAIIARMLLGRTVADNMVATTAPFADVPANHWAAKYIQYCVSRGIINGMGDNTFVPNGEVTAAQFAKMLLVAAGYGKKGEYVGADWAINAIVDAQNLKILDTGVDYMAPATRDEVARYAFNFYTKVVFVSYSKDKEDYEPKYVSGVAQTLAAQQGVVSVPVGVINGVASHKWKKNSTVELTGNPWPDAAVRVIHTYADGTPLASFTTLGSPLYKATIAADASYFVNGAQVTAPADPEDPNPLAALKTDLAAGKRGWVVSLVDAAGNDGIIDTVLVIQKSVGTLSADPFVSATGNVTIAGIAGVSNTPKAQVVGYEGLKKGDVVLYYTAGGITYIEKARAVSGQLTQGSSSAITFAGSVYRQSAVVNAMSLSTIVGNYANFNADAMIWLDNGNGVVKFQLTTIPPAMPTGVLVGYRYDDFTGTAIAKIVKEDGVLATYSVAPNVLGIVEKQSDAFRGLTESRQPGDPYGYLVNYALDDQGKVTLYKIAMGEIATGGYTAKSSVIKINPYTYDENGEINGEGAAATYYITNTTKVFYFNTDAEYGSSNRVTVTTGYAYTDSADADTVVAYKVTPGTNALSAILIGKSSTVASTSDQYVFVTKFSEPTVSYTYTVPTYYYEVYAGGEKVTLKSSSANLFKENESDTTVTPGLYKITVDSKGYVTGFDDTTGSGSRIKYINADTTFVTDGYVAAGDKVVNINANTGFFVYDQNNPVAPVLPGSVEASTPYVKYRITYVLEDLNGVAQWVYYTYTIG